MLTLYHWDDGVAAATKNTIEEKPTEENPMKFISNESENGMNFWLLNP